MNIAAISHSEWFSDCEADEFEETLNLMEALQPAQPHREPEVAQSSSSEALQAAQPQREPEVAQSSPSEALQAAQPQREPEVAQSSPSEAESKHRYVFDAFDGEFLDAGPVLLGADALSKMLAEVETTSDEAAVQHFVVAVARLDPSNTKLASKLVQAVDTHIRAMAKVHGMKREPLKAAAFDRKGREFLVRVEKIIAKVVPDVNNLPELMELLMRCHSLPEQLSRRLWQEVTPVPAGEGADTNYSGTGFQADCEKLSGPSGFGTVVEDANSLYNKGLLRGRILDTEVTWQPPLQLRAPPADRTIILGNLPLDVTEEAVVQCLEACGEVSNVELCWEWQGGDPVVAAAQAAAALSSKKPVMYTYVYGIVEFASVSAKQRATRRAAQLFGIVFREEMPTRAKTVRKFSGRTAYPQDVNLKRSLLLRNAPWSMQHREVLENCVRALAGGESASTCTIRATNCGVFADPEMLSVPHLSVSIQDSFPIMQEDADPNQFSVATYGGHRSPRYGTTDGSIVLRFDTWEAAYVARRRLHGLDLAGFHLCCGFTPERLKTCEFDSSGRPLEAPLLLDLPLPPNSAQYTEPSLDPLHRYGVPVPLPD